MNPYLLTSLYAISLCSFSFKKYFSNPATIVSSTSQEPSTQKTSPRCIHIYVCHTAFMQTCSKTNLIKPLPLSAVNTEQLHNRLVQTRTVICAISDRYLPHALCAMSLLSSARPPTSAGVSVIITTNTHTHTHTWSTSHMMTNIISAADFTVCITTETATALLLFFFYDDNVHDLVSRFECVYDTIY